MSSQIGPHVSKFIMMQFIPCLRQSGIEDGLRCLTQIAVMLNNRSSCSMSESWREKARDMVCRCKLRKKQIRFFVRRNSSGHARLSLSDVQGSPKQVLPFITGHSLLFQQLQHHRLHPWTHATEVGAATALE